MTDIGYYLKLANGQHWYLQAESALEEWLSCFAKIMLLPEKTIESGSPVWRFLIRNSSEKIYSPDYWVTFTSQQVTIHAKSDGSELVTQIAQYDSGLENEKYLRMMVAIQSLFLSTCPKGGIPVHAALIKHQGSGILISATGGTGKSTCAQRIPYPWKSLCDDSVLLVPVNGRYYAHPLPTWSDFILRNMVHSHWDVKRSLPVSAVWFLEQGNEDSTHILMKGEAASRLYQSAVQMSNYSIIRAENEKQFKEWHGLMFNYCCDAVSGFSCGVLKATLGGRFWEFLKPPAQG